MRLSAKGGLASVILLFASWGTIEIRHRIRFGHFFRPALHADVTVAKVDFGIPGITKAYDATLTNFGPIPRRVSSCEYITDAMDHGTEPAFLVQRLDKSMQTWTTTLEPSKALFCKPYPLGIIEGKVVTRLLWPGQSLSIGEEATAARFKEGDVVRFVLFSTEPWTVPFGYPTAGFVIDEEVTTASPVRVKH